MNELSVLAVEHLLLRLRPLNRALRAAVERQRQAAARLQRPDLTPLCISDEQVAQLLEMVEDLAGADGEPGVIAKSDTAEQVAEEGLRQRAKALGLPLPLDTMVTELGLVAFEQNALLLCVAAELDRAYERIFAYILDDLNRRAPCLELLCNLDASTLGQRLARRRLLGRYGRLRRYGLLLVRDGAGSGLRQELTLAEGVLERLSGVARGWCERFHDPTEVTLPIAANLDRFAEVGALSRLARGLAGGTISMVGIWGPRASGVEDAVPALARTAGRPLHRLTGVEEAPAMEQVLEAARELDAVLWLETDSLAEPERRASAEAAVALLARSSVPLCLSGTYPWRPTVLLAAREYAEVELSLPGLRHRVAGWRGVLPELKEAEALDLAARFRLNPREIQAAARTAGVAARLRSDGGSVPVVAQLGHACSVVTRRQGARFNRLVVPRRLGDDLVLPTALHRQVLEVARFYQAWPRVGEHWGLGRLDSGGGIKALFTGDSGTGKTLAAEVIAGQLGLSLLKVDLAQVVSKWVGETEKNLEDTFCEAEDSHAVLFFDEADTLFGRRGEVQRGADRYANLEVGFLLQRLEDFNGLVILASNLKDQIDEAFTRRFHIVIHFPRPGLDERRRLWRLALPATAPLDDDVDLAALERLDLTGAGIVSAARTAALLAADAGCQRIAMSHLVAGVSRQYRREARVLGPAELGRYAALQEDWA